MFDKFLCELEQINNGVIKFIQVGACDGVAGDPIHKLIKPSWMGLLIEPNKKSFQKLVKNYKGYDNLIFENIVIHDSLTEVDFYVPKQEKWRQICSIFRSGSQNRKSRNPLKSIPDSKIDQVKLKATTLDSLIEKHNIKPLDVLIIDAEGADNIVLNSMDINKYKPSIILYEHFHLPKNIRREMKMKLESLFYRCFPVKRNTLAVFQGVNIETVDFG